MSVSSSFILLLEVLLSRPLFRFFILLTSFFAALLGLLAPFFQKEFIDLLTGSPSHIHETFPWLQVLPLESPLALLFLSFICLFLSLGFSVLTNYIGNSEAILMQRKLAQRLYDHALELRTDSLQGRQVGEIVSLYATDIPGATIFLEQSLPVGASIIFPFVLAPWALKTFFDVPLWPFLSVMMAIVVLSFIMAFRQSKYFFQFKMLAAERIGLVSEWIQNIRTLRILGWVSSFEHKIFAVRKIETMNRISMVTNGQTMNSISSSVTFILNLTAIISMVYLSGSSLNSGTLMALLWIVGVFLTRPFRQMPWFFTFVFDSWTSLQRVDSFFQIKNPDPQNRSPDFRKIHTMDSKDLALSVRNLNLHLSSQHLLQGIDLDIKNGEFVTIVGEVGSGKSLLLLSLLGETAASSAKYLIGSNDALQMPLDQLRQFFTFVPQEGFIMSASLRENVAFEYGIQGPSIDQAILQSLERCQFKLTLEKVEQGLDTEIGERGVNLSGGQKQRVSLARVDYYQAPIILLDDCLSAVDVDTENRLIEDLIKGAWKNQTRILVTHRLTVLEKSDRVLYLENGRILAQGKFHELLATNAQFRVFASTVAHDESKRVLKIELEPEHE